MKPEDKLQVEVIAYARKLGLYATGKPYNAWGNRSPKEVQWAKARGLTKGHPDVEIHGLFRLPIGEHALDTTAFGGVYLEMKAKSVWKKDGDLSYFKDGVLQIRKTDSKKVKEAKLRIADQAMRLAQLRKAGCFAVFSSGLEESKKIVEWAKYAAWSDQSSLRPIVEDYHIFTSKGDFPIYKIKGWRE